MIGRRISAQELSKKFADEKARENVKAALVGPDGNPLNNRKRQGAEKIMIQQAIVTKLYQDGVIVVRNGWIHIDARATAIEDKYGSGSTADDIRLVLYHFVMGSHKTGTNVSVNGYVWRASEELVAKSNTEIGPAEALTLEAEGCFVKDESRASQIDYRFIIGALKYGECAEGWRGHPSEDG